LSFELIISSFKFKSKLRKKIIKILEDSNHSNILIFQNRKMLNKWYKEKFQNEMTL